MRWTSAIAAWGKLDAWRNRQDRNKIKEGFDGVLQHDGNPGFHPMMRSGDDGWQERSYRASAAYRVTYFWLLWMSTAGFGRARRGTPARAAAQALKCAAAGW